MPAPQLEDETQRDRQCTGRGVLPATTVPHTPHRQSWLLKPPAGGGKWEEVKGKQIDLETGTFMLLLLSAGPGNPCNHSTVSSWNGQEQLWDSPHANQTADGGSGQALDYLSSCTLLVVPHQQWGSSHASPPFLPWSEEKRTTSLFIKF